MRFIDHPVQATVRAGRLQRFHWRNETYEVRRIVDGWRYVGRWWAGEGEWCFVKVETTDGGLFELYHDVIADEWRLYRVYD